MLMNRVYCLLFVLLATGIGLTPLQAQDLNVFFKAGVSNTNFLDDEDPVFESQSGFAIGVVLNMGITRWLAFSPEVLYTTKGSKTQTDFVDEGGMTLPLDVTFELAYLEIPVLLRLQPFQRSRIRPTLHAGPAFGLNVTSAVRFKVVGADNEFRDSDDSIQGTEYGMAFGGGADVQIGFHTLSLEVRYTRGLSNLVSDDQDPKRNGALTFTAAVSL